MGPQRIVSTFHQSTSVLASVKCNLTGSDEGHLVTAKLNRLDVYSITQDGLKHESHINVQGSIVALRALQPQDGPAILLLLLDHPDPELILLRSVEETEAVRLTHVKTINLREQTALRPAEFFNDIVVDPSGTVAVVNCYASKLKVIEFSQEGDYASDFDATISENNVLSMTFLPEEKTPTLAILYVDHQNRTRLVSHEINVTELDVSPPSFALPVTDIPAKVASSPWDAKNLLIPIPAIGGCEGGGVLVCGGRKWALYEAADSNTRTSFNEDSPKSSRRRSKTQKKAPEITEAQKRRIIALIEWPWSEVRAYCAIDDSRVLVGDAFGRIAMLSFDSINTTGIILIPLGQTSSPTSISYLGNRVMYVGSHTGDSQILLISAKATSNVEAPTLPMPRLFSTSKAASGKGKGKSTEMDVDDDNDHENAAQVARSTTFSGHVVQSRGSRLDVLACHKNIAPIQDAILVDADGSGQKEILVCSGGQNTGALHLIRAGTEIEISASLQGLPHVAQTWPLKVYKEGAGLGEFHEVIVASTFESTQVFRIDNQHTFSVEPPSAHGFRTDERTICAGNLAQKTTQGTYTSQYVAQVTATGVYLLKYNEALRQYDREDDWDAQEKLGIRTEITAASINSSQVLLGLAGGRIVVVNASNGKLNTSLNFVDGAIQAIAKPKPLLPAEISAVTANTTSANANFTRFFAVAYWATQEVLVYTYAGVGASVSFKDLCKSSPLPAPIRSLLFFDFGGKAATFLLAGLSNGTLAAMTWTPGDKEKPAELGDPRIIALGDLPITLSTCNIGGTASVLAVGSRVTLVGFKNGRVTLSPIIVKDINSASYLTSPGYPDSILMSSPMGLVIGKITSQETLNVRAIPMGSSIPRCIALHKDLGVYAVVTRSVDPLRVGDAEVRVQSDLRLLDTMNFNHLSRFSCGDKEEMTSLAVGPAGDSSSSYTFAGTFVYDSSEVEPTQGRLLAFTVERIGSSVSLQLKAELSVHGCVYALTAIRPKLFAAAINSAVVIYSVSETKEDSGTTSASLEKVTEWNHNYTVTQLVYVDGKLIVGDQISSISIVELTGLEGDWPWALKTLARDYLPLWPVSIQAADEQGLTVVGANDALNLFSFSVKEDRGRKILRKDGEFHLGELVTKIIQGSLTSTENHGLKSSHIWFTSSGRIGSLVEATDETAGILGEVQQSREMRIERQRSERTGPVMGEETVGAESHAKFRAPKTTRGRSDADPAAYGFIDGDFILRELDEGTHDENSMQVDGDTTSSGILGVLESMY